MTDTITYVRELLDRVAITELIHSVARAMDSRDWTLLEGCYAPDAIGDYTNGEVDGRTAIIAGTQQFLAPLDATQHLLGNLEIKVAGDAATTNATFIAQHVRGGARFLLGGNYTDHLRRTEDGWEITRRRIRGIWSEGDPSVLTISVA